MQKLISIFLILPAVFSAVVLADTLTINITAINLNKGKIQIGIFNDSREFPMGEMFMGVSLDSDQPTQSKSLELPPGTYAIAVFQDVNSNKEFDRNLIGLPKEPYGFSGKVSGKPEFDEAKFTVTGNTEIIIELK